MDISYGLNLHKHKQAIGPYEVFLNNEPFDVEKAFVEKTENSAVVSFFGPEVGTYTRWVTFSIPLGAKPGTHAINPENPYADNHANLFEKRRNLKPPPDPTPEDPLGWVTMHYASKGYLELEQWNPDARHMKGHLKFTVYVHDQFQTFEATFDLREER